MLTFCDVLMKKIIFLLSLILSLRATEYAVIAHQKLNLVDSSQLKIKMIFLKKQKILEETTLLPINLEVSNKIRKSFEKNVLHMSRHRLKSFWTKAHYQGKRPPLNMKSTQSVLSFVQKIQGAIGYIPLTDVTQNVRIIYKWKE